MNPAEKIAAAIGRLEQLKADSTPGPWWAFDPDPTAIYGTGEFGTEPHVGDTVENADRDLIVTLHRTIDAQLDLLNAANDMKGVYRLVDGEWTMSRFGHAVLVLADAILGEST